MSTLVNRKKLTLLIFIALLFSLSNCVDTGAIKKFAALATQAGDKFPEIVSDVTASCLRSARYESMTDRKNLEFNPEKLNKQAGAKCEEFTRLEPLLLGTHKVLLTYINTMGKLAADDIVTFDSSLDNFSKSVIATGKFDEPKVNALQGIAKFLANTAAQGWRKKRLKEAIETANPDIQILTGALKEIVGLDYKRVLRSEKSNMDLFYEPKFDKADNKDPLSLIMVQKQWTNELEALKRKEEAATAYVQILDSIAKAHQELFDQRNNLNSSDVKKTILQYANSLEPLIKDLNKAF